MEEPTPEEATIRERLKTFDEDQKAAKPWPEVKRRILADYQSPEAIGVTKPL